MASIQGNLTQLASSFSTALVDDLLLRSGLGIIDPVLGWCQTSSFSRLSTRASGKTWPSRKIREACSRIEQRMSEGSVFGERNVSR